jgi:hypothetical protein
LTYVAPLSSVTSTFVAYNTFNGDTVPVYDFRVVLPISFNANGGTKYWFSPFSRTSNFQPFLAWMQGDGGDASSIQFQVDSNGTQTSASAAKAGDRTFSLEAAPEPNAVALLGMGLAAFAGSCRIRLVRR